MNNKEKIMDSKYKIIRKKMEDAQSTCWKRFNKVRCPSLKIMADYINNTLYGYTAKVEETSCCKGRQMSSGVYYSRSDYNGNKLIVKKNGKVVFEHDAIKTYRYNVEVVQWIFLQELESTKNE